MLKVITWLLQINQLWSHLVTPELDISKKAFDEAWHEGLLYKLNRSVFLKKIFETSTIFFTFTKKVKSSKWTGIILGQYSQ